MKSYIARQPIFTPSRDVFGYELLFRAGPENIFSAIDGDVASARVIADAVHLHELGALGGAGKCFINVTANILAEELYIALPPDRVVLELLETVEPNEQLLAACVKCRKAGYSLALDDYILESKFEPLLSLIDILKVDFANTTPEQQALIARQSRKRKFELLAEKVETYQEFYAAKRQGYLYFQGFFFCKPEMISSKDVVSSNLAYVQLLKLVSEPTLNHDKLADIIRQDLALSYKLLRYLNSCAFGFRHEIASINRALTLLGDEPLRKWTSLMVLGMLSERKPPELLNVSMVRARFCERILLAAGMDDRASHGFMAGMFSVLAAMLDQPLESVLNTISLPTEIEKTLRGEHTPLRPALDLALAFESADWDGADLSRNALGLPEHEIAPAYLESIKWAAEQMEFIGAAPQREAA